MMDREGFVRSIDRELDGRLRITRIGNKQDLRTAMAVLRSALRKYPCSLLDGVVEAVYVGSRLEINRGGRWTTVAGMAPRNASYKWHGMGIRHEGRWYPIVPGSRKEDKEIHVALINGDTRFFEKAFHHEVCHVLLALNRPHFETKKWLSTNVRGFSYSPAAASDTRDRGRALCRDGFVRANSKESLDEDVADLAMCMLGDASWFWEQASRHKRFGLKAALLADFYRHLHPLFSEEYLRSLARQDTEATMPAEAASRDPEMPSKAMTLDEYLQWRDGGIRAADQP